MAVSDKMRVGHFLYHYPQAGGTTTSVRGLAHGLARLGHNVTIYCCGKRCGGQTNAGELSMVWAPDKRRNPFHTPSEITRRIARNEDKLDLLVIHGIFNPRNVAVARAAHDAGLPYVVCPQGAYYPAMLRKHRWAKRTYACLYERPLLNDATAVQVFAEEQIQLLKSFGVWRPAFVVPNGFDPGEVPPLPVEGDDESHGRSPRLLFMGRLDMYTKGLDLLLSALRFGIVHGQLRSDLRLDLVGPDWGDYNRLKAMCAQMGLTQNVTFYEAAERWSALALRDITVLPSRHDAFPLVVLESMIAAKPVIVSEDTGISALVSRAGCGFVVRSTLESLCNGIAEAVASRHQWPMLGKRGRTFAFDHLTWDRIAETAAENYARVGISTHSPEAPA